MKKMPLERVGVDEEPGMLPAHLAPGAFPFQVATEEVELAIARLDAMSQNILGNQMTRTAIAQGFIEAGHRQGKHSIPDETVMKRDGTIVQKKAKQRQRSVSRGTLRERAEEPMNRRIAVRCVSVFA